MRLNQEQSRQIHEEAGRWAAREGFAGLGDVPAHRMRELIGEVAGTTHLPPAGVRDAVLAAAEASVDRQRRAAAELGVGTERRAPADPTGPAPSGVRAHALRAEASKVKAVPRSGLDALARADHRFTQTMKDFHATRVALTSKASEKTVNQLVSGAAKILSLFGQLSGEESDKQLREEIITTYRDLMSYAARDRGVFIVKSDTEVKLDIEQAPVTPRPVTVKKSEDKRYANLEAAAIADGTPELDPEAPVVLAGVPGIAVDITSGRRFVYDFHGEVKDVLTLEQLVARHVRDAKDEEGRGKALEADPRSLADLRSLTDKGLDRLAGPVTFVALEERGKTSLARVYPTRWYKAPGELVRRRMICDGPFRGIYLEDLASKLSARDRAFAYDPKQGALGPFAPKEGEPLVTTAMVRERGQKVEKLYVRIPFEREWTEVRQALRRLSELQPAITYREGTKNCGFYFDPGSYGAVRDVLRGLVLTPPALAKLEGYFDALVAVELAAADKNLGRHTAEAIGGFRKTLRDAEGRERKVETTYWQKKALAWLEARGHKGVISLDTGMGKTLVAIAAMQELRERHGVKGPFLVVCPPALRGNVPKEIHKFLDERSAKALTDDLVVMSYPELVKVMKTGEWKGKPFKPETYGAVFFDEAQWLKNPKSTRTKAALALEHPRTICLTASPMENSPMEAYVLACVANNIDLNDRTAGREHRRRMRKFKELYCETLGGRILGVKQKVELLPEVVIDPKHDLYTWVRSNLFFADKKMDDTKLTALRLSTETLVMPRGMEVEYRKKSRRILNVMRGMVSMYRDKGVAREYVDEKGRTRKDINPLARNKNISQMFGVKFAGVIRDLNELGNVPAKIDRAAELIWKRLEANPKSRAVLFSDSSRYVLESARLLSERIPGKVHAACLGKEIRLFQDGKELDAYRGHALPFVEAEHRRDPTKPADAADNRIWPATDWQQFVLGEILGKSPEVVTATMLGPVYQQGQNLQWANTGVHLDRDSWNRENTKQREARLWRKGQTQKVEFYNVDWVYKKPRDRFDRTLDEIRQLYEEVAEDLFHQIIEVPQKETKLGAEWSAVRKTATFDIDREMLLLGVVPTAKQAGGTGSHA